MEYKWMVTATNSKGDMFEEYFVEAEKADIRHTQLYNEVDVDGLWKWGSIRTTNMDTMRADTITGLIGQPREGKVPTAMYEEVA